MAQRNFVAWLYTDKQGVDYVRRADSRMTAQQGDNAPLGAVGGATAAGASPYEEMPRNLKVRRCIVKEVGVAFRANVTIYSPTAFAAIVIGTTTFQVYDGGGTAHTCVVLDKADEGLRAPIGA